MNYLEFQQIAEELGTFFNRKFTTSQAKFWFEACSKYNREIFKEAMKELKFNERFFPTLAIVMKYVDKVNMRHAMRSKMRIDKDSQKCFDSDRHHDQLTKDCVKLICGTMDKKYNCYEGMLALEKIYPSIGFKEEAEKLDKELSILEFNKKKKRK